MIKVIVSLWTSAKSIIKSLLFFGTPPNLFWAVLKVHLVSKVFDFSFLE